jgi:ABC-type glycerol-3-phosphate transport system substrate-binding protein
MHMFTRALLVGLVALTLLAGCGTDTPNAPADATVAPAGATAQPGNGEPYPVATPDPTKNAYPTQ